MKKFIGFLFLSIILHSCAIENVNFSPMSNGFTNSYTAKEFANDTEKNVELIKYTSELTNTISEIPLFKNDILNAEISSLRKTIEQYVNAIKQDDMILKKNAYIKYQQSYKKIQLNKKLASAEEQELLNRFLVKIKTNIALIDTFNSDNTK